MELVQIYRPIEKELKVVEAILQTSLEKSKNKSILKLNHFLLKSHGKRIRPALVILSAKSNPNQQKEEIMEQLTRIAAAVELIHIASLIHDDVVDHATLRHKKPSINAKWGEDVSIALGDYLYSVGFELVSTCNNTSLLSCISSATKAMCEGQLIQICERDNLSLSKQRYIFIVKKKTASLFAASCQAGAIISDCPRPIEKALKEYGLNFGIAFQIVDDYLDLVGDQNSLGKAPGQDIAVGEATLPLLNLIRTVGEEKRQTLKRLLKKSVTDNGLEKIRNLLFNSDAILYTKQITLSYIKLAKEKLLVLPESDYRKSLFDLVDFILQPFNKNFKGVR